MEIPLNIYAVNMLCRISVVSQVCFQCTVYIHVSTISIPNEIIEKKLLNLIKLCLKYKKVLLYRRSAGIYLLSPLYDFFNSLRCTSVSAGRKLVLFLCIKTGLFIIEEMILALLWEAFWGSFLSSHPAVNLRRLRAPRGPCRGRCHTATKQCSDFGC